MYLELVFSSSDAV